MRKRQHQLAAIALILAAATPAWAIFKCDDGTGKQIFQDRPCTSGKSATYDVKPATGHAPKAAPAAAPSASTGQTSTAAAKPMTEAQRLNTQADLIRKRSRLKDLNELYLGGAYEATQRTQANCRRELEALSDKKRSSMNNLAGATWEQSISAEMQAVATRCQAEQQTAQNELERLRSEKSQLERELAQQ